MQKHMNSAAVMLFHHGLCVSTSDPQLWESEGYF